MKRVSLLFTLLCFVFSWASAQTNADQLLDNFTHKINNGKGFSADFKLEIRTPQGKTKDSKTGKLLSQGKKFSITMGSTQIICDGTTIWNFDKKNKEVQVNDYDPSETTISPEKLFSNSFKKDYNYSYAGMRVMHGEKYKVVRLIPKKNTGDFTKVELLLNPKTSLLYRGYVYDKGGNVYVYTLRNTELNKNFPDSKFTFDPKAHPGTEVIDLR